MHAIKVLAVGCLLTSTSAFAHSPYLLPNYFDVSQRDHVSVQGSFTEEFFQSDIVMKAEDYHVVGPDGMKRHRLGPAAGRTAFSYTVALTLEVSD